MEERNISLHFRRKHTDPHTNRIQLNVHVPLLSMQRFPWSVEWIGRWPIEGMQAVQGRAYAERQSMSKGWVLLSGMCLIKMESGEFGGNIRQ